MSVIPNSSASDAAIKAWPDRAWTPGSPASPAITRPMNSGLSLVEMSSEPAAAACITTRCGPAQGKVTQPRCRAAAVRAPSPLTTCRSPPLRCRKSCCRGAWAGGLAGRIAHVELDPFDVLEAANSYADVTNLWVRGGFPDGALAGSDHLCFAWRGDRVARACPGTGGAGAYAPVTLNTTACSHGFRAGVRIFRPLSSYVQFSLPSNPISSTCRMFPTRRAVFRARGRITA